MMTRRSWFVYGTLLAIWILLIGWQAAEHARTRKAARAALRRRAEAICNTLALTMRATARGPFASSERIEAWLNGLVEQGEVISIKLLQRGGRRPGFRRRADRTAERTNCPAASIGMTRPRRSRC